MLKRVILPILLIVLIIGTVKSQVVSQEYEYGSGEYFISRELFDRGLLRQAEIRIIEMIRNFPYAAAHDKALLMQAEMDLYSGNHSVALNKLGEFIKTRANSPLMPHSHLQRGYIEFERNNFTRSEQFFSNARQSAESQFRLRRDSTYKQIAHEAVYWQAISLASQGKQLDALPIFEIVVKDYSIGEFADDAQYAIATIHEINRDYTSAIANYRKLQKEFEYRNTLLASYIREANNHIILRDFRSALLSIERAETINRIIKSKNEIGKRYEPQSYAENIVENLLYLRGEAYNMGSNFPLAVSSFEDLLKRFPNSYLRPQALLGAGWAYLNLYDYQKAIDYYNQVINLSDNDADRNRSIAQLFRAVSIKRSGDTVTARRELSALSVKADFPYIGIVLLELGQMNYEEGNFQQARKDLERADREALDAKTAVRVSLLLGATYLELKMFDNANNEYKKAGQLAFNSSPIFLPQRNWYLSEARLKQGISLVQSLRSGEAIKPLLEYIGDNKESTRLDEALFWLAEAYYRADMLQNAADTYRRIVAHYPLTARREEVLYGLGWSHFRMKNFDQSSRIFDQLVREFPTSPFSVEVLTRQGDGYYLMKNYAKAAESYQKALRLAPNTEEGQYSAYQLAHAYYRLQRYEQAITALLDFVNRYKHSPYSPNALYLIGWIRFQQHKYAESIDNFNFLIQAYPQSNLIPRAYYAIADAHYNLGNYEEAIKGYRYVVQTFPSSELAPEALKSVQFALMALGRDAEVIGIADEFISTNPNSPFVVDFKYKRAEMFYTGRKYSDAVAEFQNFAEKYPDSDRAAEALYWMGKSYANMNDTRMAAQAYSNLFRRFPQSDYAPIGLLEYGLLEKQHNHILKADSVLGLLQFNYPTHQAAAQAGFERAMIKYALLDTLGAIRMLKRVADEFPTMDYGDFSRYRVAMFYRSKDLFDSSRTHFAILARIEENPIIASESQYRLGELSMREDDCPRAIEQFLKVKDKFAGYEDWFSLALLNLGECYEKTNQFDFAREMYNILESLRPDDDFGRTAKSRLRRLK